MSYPVQLGVEVIENIQEKFLSQLYMESNL